MKKNLFAVLSAATAFLMVFVGCSLDSEKIYEETENISSNTAPSDLVGKATSENSIAIAWNPVKKSELYYIYRIKSGKFTYIGESITDSYEDIGNSAVQLTSNTRYFYKVSAMQLKESLEFESYSDSISVVTLAEIPDEMFIAVNSSSSITIRWTKEDVEGYAIYRRDRESGEETEIHRNMKQNGNSADTVFADNDLFANRRYTYSVAPINSDGVLNDKSTEVSALTMLTTPTNPIATAMSSSRINISWDEVEFAAAYRVYRSETENGDYVHIGNTSASYLNYSDVSLPSNKTYFYKVEAYTDNNFSELSASVSATTMLDTPRNISLQYFPDGNIITWDGVEYASGYRIYRSDSEDGDYALVGSTFDVRFKDIADEQMFGKSLYYRISAFTENNRSLESAPVSIVTPPGGIKADYVSHNYISISWNGVSSAQEYYIYRSTTEDGEYREYDYSDEPYYTDFGVSAGTAYFYKISVVKNGRESARSLPVSAMTAPSGASAYEISTSEIEITCNTVIDASEYILYRSTTEDGEFLPIMSRTEPYFVNAELNANTQYWYKISVVKNGRESAQSQTVSAITLESTGD